VTFAAPAGSVAGFPTACTSSTLTVQFTELSSRNGGALHAKVCGLCIAWHLLLVVVVVAIAMVRYDWLRAYGGGWLVGSI
jgi:hypothetical protein